MYMEVTERTQQLRVLFATHHTFMVNSYVKEKLQEFVTELPTSPGTGKF
jgi:predicted translin family RNA/ssDNA-binding protein